MTWWDLGGYLSRKECLDSGQLRVEDARVGNCLQGPLHFIRLKPSDFRIELLI